MLLPEFIRRLLPASLRRWQTRGQLRLHAADLNRLRFPDVTFAELYRASRATGWYAAQQVESEIIQLLELIHQRQCQTLLEIGTSSGGTLFLLTRAASPQGTFVSIDIDMAADRWECLRTFARNQQRLVSIVGNSNDQRTKARVDEVLAGRPLDFLLIDGDHSAYGVRQDFDIYAPRVAAGGIIALHDICLAGGVKEFWPELRSRYRTDEFVAAPDQNECGIGVVHV